MTEQAERQEVSSFQTDVHHPCYPIQYQQIVKDQQESNKQLQLGQITLSLKVFILLVARKWGEGRVGIGVSREKKKNIGRM